MEANEKIESTLMGIPVILSWGGLALIATTLFICGANEWSLIPVFAGIWILWRGASGTTGLAIYLGIGLAIFLTRFGVSLERGVGLGLGWETHPGSILMAHEEGEILPALLGALGIIVGHWLFCAGVQMESIGNSKSEKLIELQPFFASGKWVTWFWIFALVSAGGLGVYEILLKHPDDFLSKMGWSGSIRLGRFLVLAWLLGVGVVLVRFWIRLPFGVSNSQLKSLGYLQDILWRETRREQSRSEQWIVHAVQKRRKAR